MKKLIIAALIGLFVLGFGSTAKATVYNLVSGTTVLSPAVHATEPTGTLIASIIGGTFTGKDIGLNTVFTGTYNQWVLQDPSGNLAFLYQFTNDVGYTAALNRFSTSDFSEVTTSAAYVMQPFTLGLTYGVDATAGTNPDVLNRNGGTIGLSWFTTLIQPGDTSPLLWIQTDGQYLKSGTSSLQDGGTANFLTYAPSKVPEPASMSLLGLGLVGFVGRMIRRKARA